MKEGEILENIKCVGNGNGNDGLFVHDKIMIFVPETRVNKRYNIKITKVLQNIAFGKVTILVKQNK